MREEEQKRERRSRENEC